MRNRNLFHALEGLGARSDIVDSVKNLGAVVSRSAGIANTYENFFENDKTLFVLKGLAVDFLRPHGALAVLAWVIVGSIFSGT